MSQVHLVPQCANPNVIPIPKCGKCGHNLSFVYWKDSRGVPCVRTDKVTENYCPNCGEPVEYPPVLEEYQGEDDTSLATSPNPFKSGRCQ